MRDDDGRQESLPKEKFPFGDRPFYILVERHTAQIDERRCLWKSLFLLFAPLLEGRSAVASAQTRTPWKIFVQFCRK